METRANYVLIGACALAAIVLGLGFFVWLAKLQIDRQYAYYDVLFDDVSGLSRAADVRFSGLSVGQVVVARARRDERGAGAGPDRGGGRHADPRGRDGAAAGAGRDRRLARLAQRRAIRRSRCCATRREGVPVIQGQRSVVQSLTEDAPDLLAESIKLVKEFQGLVGAENQAKVAAILGNVEQASGAFETALSDFSTISKSVAGATGRDLGLHRQARPAGARDREGAGRGADDDGGDDRRLQHRGRPRSGPPTARSRRSTAPPMPPAR